MTRCERQEIVAFVSQQIHPVGRHDEVALSRKVLREHLIDEFALGSLHGYFVVGAQVAYVGEGRAVGGAVPGDRSVAGLSGHRCP